MQAVSQSPFLQALGYAIANSLWQAGLVWLLICAVHGTFKLTSRQRYLVAFIGQLTCFVWFIFTLQYYYEVCAEAAAAIKELSKTENLSIVGGVFEETNKFKIATLFAYFDKLLPYLSVAYLSLLALLLIRWTRCYLYINIIRTKGITEIENKWRAFVERMTAELNISDHVTIALSNIIKTPLTVGFIKPVILIPLASINHLTAEQLEALILHELAHIKRADYILNLYQTIFEKVLFFNPFTQLIKRIIEKERENSCDDWVVQLKYNPSMYAQALLKVAYLQSQPDLAMQATGNNKSSDLVLRVKRLLNQPEKVFNYKQQMGALVLLTTLLACVAFIKPTAVHTKKPIDTVAKNIILNPVISQVDNIWYNPVSLISKTIEAAITKPTQVKTHQKTSSTVTAKPLLPQTPADPEIFYGKPEEVETANWQAETQKALQDAQLEISKAEWIPVIKNLSKIVDTTVISNSIKAALDASNIKWNEFNKAFTNLKTLKPFNSPKLVANAQLLTKNAEARLELLNAKKSLEKQQRDLQRRSADMQKLLARQAMFASGKAHDIGFAPDVPPAPVPVENTVGFSFNANDEDDNNDEKGDAVNITAASEETPSVLLNSDNKVKFFSRSSNGVKTITITKEGAQKLIRILG